MRRIDLGGDWRLTRVATARELPGRVPGDTHSALLAAGAIPDPYGGTNELAVQWVGREDWEYSRDFEVGGELLREDMVLLTCDCLDTIAGVSINGKSVARADNQFVRWRFDAKPFLRPGKNTIRILFRSAEKTALREAARLPYPVPARHVSRPVAAPQSRAQGPVPRGVGLGPLPHGRAASRGTSVSRLPPACASRRSRHSRATGGADAGCGWSWNARPRGRDGTRSRQPSGSGRSAGP